MTSAKEFSIGIGAVIISGLILAGCGGSTSDGNTSSSSSSSSASSSTSSSSTSSSGSSSSSSSSGMPARKLSLVYAINAGSNTATTMAGVTYQPDNFYTGGSLNSTSDTIGGTVDDAVYQTERYGNTTYEIPVTNGIYTVALHMVELFHQTAGARSFSVAVEGNRVLTNIDLYRLAGHDTAFEYIVRDVDVRDGQLTIALTTGVDNATISGIAIYSDSGGRLAQ